MARALAADPPVLLMDEPFGAVDPAGRRHLQAEFWKIQRTLGTTVMLVTHDIDEAVRLGDRIAVFSQGGHLEQLADAVTLLARPETDRVRDFVGTGRAVRLLGIGEVAATDLDPLPTGVAGDVEHVAADLAPRDAVRVHGRLDDAFAALAASGGQPVTVLGEDGRPAGLLSMTGPARSAAADHRRRRRGGLTGSRSVGRQAGLGPGRLLVGEHPGPSQRAEQGAVVGLGAARQRSPPARGAASRLHPPACSAIWTNHAATLAVTTPSTLIPTTISAAATIRPLPDTGYRSP